MNIKSIRTMFVLAGVSVSSAFAATHTIGVASAVGTFSVNSATVTGNANLVSGSEVRTAASPSMVMLQNGSSLALAPNSAGTVYANRFVLTNGAARADRLGLYSLDAKGFSIKGVQPNSQASVSLVGNTLEVASLAGDVRVFDSKGALLTRVGAGTSSSFKTNDPPTGATGGTAAAGTSTALILTSSLGTAALVIAGVALVTAEDNSSTPTSP